MARLPLLRGGIAISRLQFLANQELHLIHLEDVPFGDYKKAIVSDSPDHWFLIYPDEFVVVEDGIEEW